MFKLPQEILKMIYSYDDTYKIIFDNVLLNIDKKKYYLCVPYNYKDKAKKLNAKWDWEEKSWYSMKNNIYHNELINLYHMYNFRSDFYGSHLINKPLTLKEVDEANDKEHFRYNHHKQNWINKNGTLNGFNQWYSVCVLNHD